MATVSRSTSDPLAVASWSDGGEGDSKSSRYLAQRLAAAGADYKGVALTTFLLAAAVAFMLWLATGVVVEHWLVPGGLATWARWTWFALGLACLLAALVRWIVPLLRYRVNLVYAARVIERDHPELHNDLVNAVLVQAQGGAAAPLVIKSLRRRAAKRLSGVPAEGVIDRTPALRLAYALAALVAAACIYELAAPKSLASTTARLVAPWLSMAAPSRVHVTPPTLSWRLPGDPASVAAADRALPVSGGVATLIRGRQVLVSSEITGLAADERPTLVVTPVHDDGTAETGAVWRAALVRSGTGTRYAALLPDAARGLEQSLDLVIAAGDARSGPLRVMVVDAPSLMVREVLYHYPEYTRQEDETVAWQGDVRGVEGTKVTIVAESNQPLESAWIDLGCDGSRDVALKLGPRDLARVSGTFTLRMNGERTGADAEAYRLVFQPRSSTAKRERAVTEKLEHRIEVIPDLAPEVTIEEPAEKVMRVPPGSPVPIRVQAVDPDFGLASVRLETRLQGGPVRQEAELLQGRSKQLRTATSLVPERLGAGPGSVLEYRALAIDNRPEPANQTATEWRALRIDAAAPPPEEPPPASRDEGPNRVNGADRNDGGDGSTDAGKQGGSGAAGGGESPSDRPSADGAPENGGRDNTPDAGESADAGGEQRTSANKPQAGDAGQQPGGEPPPAQQGRGSERTNGGQTEQTQPSKRQPEPAGDPQQGSPQEGKQQGGGEGGKSQEQGRAGKNPGAQQQQPGSRDGAGEQPQGQGGQQQGGGRDGGSQERQQGNRPTPGAAGGAPQDGNQKGGDQKQQGQPQERGVRGESGGRKPAPAQNVAADGTNDGEAMERILENRRRSQAEKPEPKTGTGDQKGGDQKGGDQKGGDQKGGDQKGGDQKGGDQKGGDQKGGDQKGGDQKGGDQKGGDQKGGDQKGGD
ncbi:MAG: hypothetical protein DWI03_10365, partial [Planctomycetota bacterium]